MKKSRFSETRFKEGFGAEYVAKATGDVGIEVELEGSDFPFGVNYKWWKLKEEGSLRGGGEIVLKGPLGVSQLPAAFEEYQRILAHCGSIRKTIRCSTHIHINIIHNTQFELMNALVLYFLFEELFVRSQGPNRIGNLFCLRMSDAEGVLEALRRIAKGNEGFQFCNQNQNKYAAVNLATPYTFGSIEFRFMQPMTDTDELMRWTMMLLGLVRYGSTVPAHTHLQNLRTHGWRWMMAQFTDLPPDWLAAMAEKHSDGVTADELVYQNFDNLEKLATLMKGSKYYKLPEHLWDPDLGAGFGNFSYTAESVASPLTQALNTLQQQAEATVPTPINPSWFVDEPESDIFLDELG